MTLSMSIRKTKGTGAIVPNRHRIDPLLSFRIQCPWAEVRATMPSGIFCPFLNEYILVTRTDDLGIHDDVLVHPVTPRWVARVV